MSLKEVVKRAGESITKIGIQGKERVLPKISHLVPRVEHIIVLVCARESHLYADVAVHTSTIAFTL